jgi:hypothetical protein
MNKFNEVQVQGREPEEIKKAELKAKEEKAKIKTAKQKTYFDVKIEALVPCLLTYRILADDENSAIDQALKIPPNHIKPNGRPKNFIRATVYTAGSLWVKLTRSFK